MAAQQTGGLSYQSAPDDALQPGAVWQGQPVWIELLRDGLTFDISALAPGPEAQFPQLNHRFDLSALPTPATHDVIGLHPGPHLAGGSRSQSVVRAMLSLACDLALQFDDLAAIGWGPSHSAIGRRFFESTIKAWLGGGPFPALGLTAFADGPGGALHSAGLEFWIGQELRIEPPLCADRIAATRLGVRLVNQLVLSGRIDAVERITAPDGRRLVLDPSPGGAVINVRRE